MEKESKFKVPHVYVLLIGIILICSALTYIIPAGSYDMMTIETPSGTRDVVNPETFQYLERTPVTLMQFLSSIPRGMNEAAGIIFFIFIVGGSFGVLQDTGAIEAGLGKLTKKFSGKETLLIPVIMIAFAFGGAVIGMAEETLPFIPIMVSLCIALGFDSLTGAAIVFMGAGAGFAGAFMNPFTIGVAQGIAELPLFSGMGLRLILFATTTTTAIAFVMRYANKIKKNPSLSPMYEIDMAREDNLDLSDIKEFGSREKAVLMVFVLSIGILIYGVIKHGWYFDEISALFLGMAIVAALIGKMGLNGFCQPSSHGTPWGQSL